MFPSDRFPFPWEDVRRRWAAALAEPDVVVEVVDGEAGLEVLLAHDGETLRHLAVHPDRWGRGWARAAVERATAAGATRLWCLVDNHRARGVYERLGFRPTGGSWEAVWPPHPTEIELRQDRRP